MVLKCARLAVNVLSTLSEEVRARGVALGLLLALASVCAQTGLQRSVNVYELPPPAACSVPWGTGWS